MENTPLVSVVIPVYNAERYLRQCLDSVVTQTLREIEILCVNDGSSDSSLAILQEYADKDARLRVFTQENAGPGAARNRALDEALGEYLIFWDADDHFRSDALEKLYRAAKAQEADVCVCDAQDFEDDSGAPLDHSYLRRPYPDTPVFSAADCPERIFNFTSTVVWNKLIRRQFLLDASIRFPPEHGIEDIRFTLLLLALAGRICVCDEKLIFYRVGHGGTLASFGKMPEFILRSCDDAHAALEARGLLADERLRRGFLEKVAGLYLFMLQLCDDYSVFRRCYDLVTGEGSLLADCVPSEDMLPVTARFLRVKALGADDYLYSDYQTLLRRCDRQTAAIAELKAQLQETRQKLGSVWEELKLVRRSFSFRLGTAITKIPREIRERLREK